MTDFANLTMDQQRQLWLELAHDALQRWDLKPQKMRWLGHGGNVVFHVPAGDADFVLRLHPPGRADAVRLSSELGWLASIRRDTDLIAPYPVAALVDGRERLSLEMQHDLLPHASVVHAALFKYIEGKSKPAPDLSAEDVYRVGEYLGALHSEAQFKTAGDFEGPRLDWAGLFGDDSPYASLSETGLESEHRGVLDQVAEQLRVPLSELATKPDAMGLIHADLLAKNILFRADSIAALDFEYCGWGFYLYDLAPLLWQLKGERATDYMALEQAMWGGYTSVRPRAESDRALLESFIAARQFASIRWLRSNLDNPAVRVLAPALIAERCAELKLFIESGILRRSTPTL